MTEKAQDWQFWVDQGGTFTNIVVKAPDSKLLVHKFLSEQPPRYRDTILQEIRYILNIPPDALNPLLSLSEYWKQETSQINQKNKKVGIDSFYGSPE